MTLGRWPARALVIALTVWACAPGALAQTPDALTGARGAITVEARFRASGVGSDLSGKTLVITSSDGSQWTCTGGTLPTPDGRVQMYPCYSFEFHLMLVTIDPDLGKPEIKRYILGHDCGTVINPKIVRGMTMGGIAHGIGAALYEEFAYSGDGLLMAQNFMDYLLPSAHEVPPVEIVHHETPSPLTVFGQKGSGESGYLGAPAAIASAVNDAIRPLGIAVNSLPIKVARLGDMIAAARG